jgi:hypothetical protein
MAGNRKPAGALLDGSEFDEPMNFWDKEISKEGIKSRLGFGVGRWIPASI